MSIFRSLRRIINTVSSFDDDGFSGFPLIDEIKNSFSKNSNENTATIQPTFVTCEYCGSSVELNSSGCPNCGAGIKK